jgi:hypothetical protein
MVVLELSRGLLQGVVDGEVETLVLGVPGGIARYDGLFTGHVQPNAKVVDVAFVMMVARSFTIIRQDSSLSKVLELARPVLDRLSEGFGRFDAAKGDLEWVFHRCPRPSSMAPGSVGRYWCRSNVLLPKASVPSFGRSPAQGSFFLD